MTTFKLIEPPKNITELFKISKFLRYCNNLDEENPTAKFYYSNCTLSEKQLKKIKTQGFILLTPLKPLNFLLRNLPSCKYYDVLVDTQISQDSQPEVKLYTQLSNHLKELPEYIDRPIQFASWLTEGKIGDFDLGQLIVWSGDNTLNENEITSIIKKSN